MDVKLGDLQKKQLEKIYNKVYEGNATDPQLTDEGRQICVQLNINPEDLRIYNQENFN